MQRYTLKDGLKNDHIHSICGHADGTILTGDSEGRLYLYANGKLKTVWTAPKMASSQRILVLKILRAGEKTVVMTNSNVYVLNSQYKLEYTKHNNTALIKSMYKLDDNHILLGSISALYQLNISEKSVNELSMPLVRYTDLFMSKKGEYWIGNNNGLYCYLTHKNKWIALGAQYAICQKRISKISQSKDGIIWVGTASHGLLGFKDQKLIAHIDAKQGLPSSYIHSIVLYKGAIWIATNSGLYSINYQYNQTRTINKIKVSNYSGIGNLTLGEIYTFEESLDKFYLGTSKGLVQFYPRDIQAHDIINTIITSLRINLIDSPVKSRYVLPYSQNTISIAYTGVTYGQANELSYRYRLRGLQNEYVETNETIKEFGPLEPGKYEFEVFCADLSGKPLGKKASLMIEITPAYYQTIWFKIIFGLFVFFILYLIKKRYQRIKEKESNTKLEIAELEMQAVRAQINPHFIFNCLNSIQHMVNIQDSTNANKYIAKFAQLIRQTLELSKNNTIPLSEELTYIENYLLLEKMRFQDSFDYQIIYDKDLDYHNYFIPSMIMQPYIENSIRHGVKYLKDKSGLIRIELIKNSDSISCIIDDNGIGRKLAMAQKHSKPIEYQSRGTELNQKRIDNYNLINLKKISVFIEDKLDSHGNSQGTRIHIKLPI